MFFFVQRSKICSSSSLILEEVSLQFSFYMVLVVHKFSVHSLEHCELKKGINNSYRNYYNDFVLCSCVIFPLNNNNF